MSTILSLTPELNEEYDQLFKNLLIRPAHSDEVTDFVNKCLHNKDRYAAVAQSVNADIPWWFVAIIHGREADFDFTKHLHNGDSLNARTHNVPAGRPLTGTPPFKWEDSAIDALKMKGLDKPFHWDNAGALYQFERYNGFGYRQYHSLTLDPYLWSYTYYYSYGLYVSDGNFSATAVSKQVGAAAAMRLLVDTTVTTTGIVNAS